MMRRSFKYCLVSGLISFIIVPICTIGLADEIDMDVYISQPDEIVIYEGDFAYVKDTSKIDAQDVIQVELPGETILRTLFIFDGGKMVKSFTFSKVEATSHPSLILYGEKKTTNSQEPLIGKLSPVPSPQKTIVSWKTDTKGKRDVILEYAVSKISWSPAYKLKISNADKTTFICRALIANTVMPLKDVRISLISGETKERRWQNPGYYNQRLPSELATIYDIILETKPHQAPSPRINDGYTYEVGKQDLNIGTTAVELLTTKLTYKKELIWAILYGQRVDVHYEVKNTTKQTLAKGGVDLYQDDMYIGMDNILCTPPGHFAHITFCGMSNIKVDKTIDVTSTEERNRNRNHHKVELKLQNLSDKEITMKVFDIKYPDAFEMEYSIKPAKESGNTIVWEITIPAKGEKSILYDFYSNTTYRNPYQTYY